ncbi:MAG TPA: DNA-processing protein DprA [Candidatus Mcinerneyibacterium sp.]|nr:DNA-processing protein DprA [Candidatus Mcinerneyibacterium sp.]
MKHKYYYLLLKYLSLFSSPVWLKLIKKAGSIEELFNKNKRFFSNIRGLKKNKIDEFINKRTKIKIDKILEQLKKKKINFVSINCDNYPSLLKNIYDPPLVLFFKGNKINNNKINLGVVGTRKISSYGKKVTKKIVSNLDKDIYSVVSGMALGIDKEAHKNALENNIYTVAVLGCGVDYIYPRSNHKIYKRIIEKGTVISEFLPGSSPKPYRFPLRNRIISGMSRGVLVIEGTKKSGSLITARSALDQNRDVFAVPGNIFFRNCRGTNYLLKQGAFPVVKAKDIDRYWKVKSKIKSKEKKLNLNFNKEEKEVIKVMNPIKALTIDDIYLKLSGEIELTKIMAVLFKLKLKEVVEELPGKKFVLYDEIF